MVGEPGLGKTAVRTRGRELAAPAGLKVGFGRGHPMEGTLPFGVLIQVLDGLGGHGLLREDQPSLAYGHERAARFFGVLRWLQRRGGGPVLLVIDDLHWADADSLALCLFLCRRLASLRAGLLASLRPWPVAALDAATGLVSEGGARAEHLAPLTTTAAAALLQARVGRPVPAETSRRARAATRLSWAVSPLGAGRRRRPPATRSSAWASPATRVRDLLAPADGHGHLLQQQRVSRTQPPRPAELAVDPLQMRLDRPDRDRQLAGDLGIGGPGGQPGRAARTALTAA